MKDTTFRYINKLYKKINDAMQLADSIQDEEMSMHLSQSMVDIKMELIDAKQVLENNFSKILP